MIYAFKEKDALHRMDELPDPFLKPDGTRVTDASQWPAQRAYLKAMLAHYLYGDMPPPPDNTTGRVLFARPCYAGRAIAETVEVSFGPGLCFQADIIRPVKEGRVPVITWNQFTGRHGSPLEEEIVLRRGYAIAEFDKEQLASDSMAALTGPLAKAYSGYGWGAIAMWAYMQSRLIDYLALTDYADMSRIVATGHSRGGKVALCASIYDERVALAAINGSGCGGAGCFRYLGGRMGEGTGLCETAGSICDVFPFWWAGELGRYGRRGTPLTGQAPSPGERVKPLPFSAVDIGHLGKTQDEHLLPFDLHTLKALVAPRAIITTDALGDTWANPYGTQLTWRAAQEVFDFLGVPDRNALHMRDGDHAYNATDWQAVIDFCDMVFFDKKRETDIVRMPSAPAGQSALAAALDWRNERLHFTWRRPC